MNHYEAQLAKVADTALPAGTVVIWTGTACPAGYSEVTALRGTFPRAVPSGGTVGATGGASTHTHTINWAGPSSSRNMNNGGGTSIGLADSSHDHSGTNLNSASSLPPYTDVLYCQKG